MKKIIISIILILLVICCVFYIIIKNDKADIPIDEMIVEETTFVVTSRGEDYLDMGSKGARVGDKIDSLNLVNVSGEGVQIIGNKKTLLVFASSYNEMFYPLVQDWAETYKRMLEIVIVCKEQPTPELKEKWDNSGICAVMNYDKVAAQIDPGYMGYNYLIDEDGKIVHRFKFVVHLWREMARNVDLFTRKSLLLSEAQVSPMALGEPLPWLMENEQLIQCLNMDSCAKKPTILFLLEPGDQVSKQLLPLIQSLHKYYDENINLCVIYSVYCAQNEIIAKEYFERYGLLEQFASWKELANVTGNAEKNILGDGIQVYYDQNRQFFDQSEIWMIPTVLVLDKDLKLVEIFGISLDGGTRLKDMENQFQIKLNKLL